MSTADLLSQEEIEALLNSVDEGDIETESDEFQDNGIAKNYDFRNQARIPRRRLRTLEMINERFSKSLRISLFKLLQRSPEISISGIQIKKFYEYIDGLHAPTNLNIIRFSPLRGRGLIVMEPFFVFTAVDNFFGGNGQFDNLSEGRDFTLTEMRVIRIILDMIFKNLKEAWQPVMELNFEYMSSEINPHYANIVGAEDTVVISTLNIALEGIGGDINIVMPYSMIEPIRTLLDAIGDDGDETDIHWRAALRNEVMSAKVTMNSLLVEKTIHLSEVLHFKKGDVIPITMPDTVILRAEGVSAFVGKVVISDGNYAVQIIDRVTPEEH